MGSDAGWKVEGPRENITIIKKGFKKALLFCKKSGGGGSWPPAPPSLEALEAIIGGGR